MSVYRPKRSPYYCYDFQFEGVRFQGSTGTTKKSEAKIKEAKVRFDASMGIRPKKNGMSMNAAAGRYWLEVAGHQPSSKTTDYQLSNLVDVFGANTLLSDITDNEISEYVARRRSKISNASVNRETQLLRRVFRRAQATWKADIGEMPDWKSLILSEPAERNRELTAAEEAALFDNLRPDFHPLVLFCILSGVRAMNAITLTWGQVDFENKAITFKVKSKRLGGKTHVVPMTSAMVALVAQQRGNSDAAVFTYVCKKSRHMRHQGRRYAFSRSGWKREWGTALDAAGIEDFRFHDLRHTAASRLARVANLRIVQEMLGHEDIASTVRYTHVQMTDVLVAMEKSQNSPTHRAPDIDKLLKVKQ